jgi:phosphatidylglycerol---prolipoprotein diacylglyceryl transferase
MEFQSPGPVFSVGFISLNLYMACTVAGFLSSGYAAVRLLKRWGYSFDVTVPGSIVCFLGGLAGARIYYVLICWHDFLMHAGRIFSAWGHGRSIHGGVIGGTIAGAIYCRMIGFPFLVACDVAGAVLGLGQGIGRWGNFFNSEAFGLPVESSFPLKLYISIEQRPIIYQNYKFFHPTFLYESLWDLAMFSFLYFLAIKKLRACPGACFLAYVILYSVGRLLIESLRTDRIMFGVLPTASIASGISLIASLVGAALLVHQCRTKNRAVDSKKPADAA